MMAILLYGKGKQFLPRADVRWDVVGRLAALEPGGRVPLFARLDAAVGFHHLSFVGFSRSTREADDDFLSAEVDAIARACPSCIHDWGRAGGHGYSINTASGSGHKKTLGVLIAALGPAAPQVCQGTSPSGKGPLDVAHDEETAELLRSCGARIHSADEREAYVAERRAAERREAAAIEAGRRADEERFAEGEHRVAEQRRRDAVAELRRRDEEAAVAMRRLAPAAPPAPERGDSPSSRSPGRDHATSGERSKPSQPSTASCAPADTRRPQGTCIAFVSDARGKNCNKPNSYSVRVRNTCSERVSVRLCIATPGAPDCVTHTIGAGSEVGNLRVRVHGSLELSGGVPGRSLHVDGLTRRAP